MADPDALRECLAQVEGALVAYLDALIRDSADYLAGTNARRDAQEAYADLWRLSGQADARYDLVLSGDLYAAWYQLSRVAHAAGVLDEALDDLDGDLEILDIGCGTGATAWAGAVVEQARRESGAEPRRLRIRGIDGSPSMVQTATEAWSFLSEVIDTSDMDVEFITSSWRNVTPRAIGGGLTDSVVVGGYVFDRSDDAAPDDLADDLGAFLDAFGAQRAVLFGAHGKRAAMSRVLRSLASDGGAGAGWRLREGRVDRSFVPNGSPQEAGAARRRLLEASGVRSRDTGGVSWGYASESTYAVMQRTGQVGLRLGAGARIVLDAAQTAAVKPNGRPTLILGAAGSGKSEVLVHRLVATVEGVVRNRTARRRAGRQRILVTAHNKYMLDHLVLRTKEELSGRTDPLEISYDECPISSCLSCLHEPKASEAVNCVLSVGSDVGGVLIQFMNWDRVFTKLLRIPAKSLGPTSTAFLRHAPEADRRLLESLGIDDDYLTTEFWRVVYGQRVRSRADYARMIRRGRAMDRLPRDGEARAAIWRTIDAHSERRVRRDFTNVRYDGWLKGAQLDGAGRWDHVFVDEGQDFSDADFEIVGRLVVDPGGVIVALDPTQSQYLGASFRLPSRIDLQSSDGGRRNWNHHHLSRTHRLSISISRAIRPVAEEVGRDRDDIIALDPRKSAVIGARPIVVDVRSPDELHKIADILRVQSGYLGVTRGGATIDRAGRTLLFAGTHDWYSRLEAELEESSDGEDVLSDVLESSKDRSSYYRGEWKGLEFEGVVWITGARLGLPSQTAESAREWVYTVLSRARSLLIIVLTQDTDSEVRRIVGLLDAEHLRFWEEMAQQEFLAWRSIGSAPVPDDIPF